MRLSAENGAEPLPKSRIIENTFDYVVVFDHKINFVLLTTHFSNALTHVFLLPLDSADRYIETV